ncbi:MAG: hypothetical protein R3C09_01670 [Pirellulaceae bacterium]
MRFLKIVLSFVCCIGSTSFSYPAIRACADEPLRLAHRWEVEPDLGIEWLAPRTPLPLTLHPERFASSQLQVVLDESRHALQYADQEDLAGRELALEAILERLKNPPENRQLVLALAGAAIALADGSHAQVLWERLRDAPATRPLIDRALVDWMSPVALDSWRTRLLDPSSSQSDLLLAIEGVGATGSAQDRPALEALLRSDRHQTPLKISIARALGSVATADLESLANDILAAEMEHRELLVAELLSRHTSPAARGHLRSIVDSSHQPARTVAYTAISRNYAELARELAPQMLEQNDNNLRAQAVAVLDQYDDAVSLRYQAARIADRNYELRVSVRENLLRKTRIPELRIVVDEVIDEQLDSDVYQGIEQAILLSVALREAERCPTYLKLLEFPRPETSLIAAWALQELAQTPELMEGILTHTRFLTDRLIKKEPTYRPEHLRQAFLFEAMGRNRYQPAVEMLKLYIDKHHWMGDFCRASAIWALGKILEDSQDADVAQALAERMLDMDPENPEDPLVQFNSTVALGWIKAPQSLEKLRAVPAVLGAHGQAAQWAQQQFAK